MAKIKITVDQVRKAREAAGQRYDWGGARKVADALNKVLTQTWHVNPSKNYGEVVVENVETLRWGSSEGGIRLTIKVNSDGPGSDREYRNEFAETLVALLNDHEIEGPDRDEDEVDEF